MEVESDVTPDYSEMYHYRDDQWVKVTDFDFYSVIPGRFIGTFNFVKEKFFCSKIIVRFDLKQCF